MELQKITFSEYKLACEEFAEDSKDWYSMEEGNHYKAGMVSSPHWVETTDGGSGILDVSWAFHKTSEEIEKEVKERFLKEINFLFDILMEEEEDMDKEEKEEIFNWYFFAINSLREYKKMKPEKIKTICCKCGKFIKGNKEGKIISHGFCKKCYKIIREEYFKDNKKK